MRALAFFLGGFLAIGLIAFRVTMLDLDVAVIHSNGTCVAINQHTGATYQFGSEDSDGKCLLGRRFLFAGVQSQPEENPNFVQ